MRVGSLEKHIPDVPKTMDCPEELGFKSGSKSVHTSRTMMLQDLSLLLTRVPRDSTADDYLTAIVVDNELGKPTRSTRKMSAEVLARLYGLNPKLTIYRAFRRLWDVDEMARPMLAFLLASARDPLLRETLNIVLDVPVGNAVTSPQIASHLSERYPQRFQPSTSIATAQRLASSWAQAGYLVGKARKRRAKPVVTPIVAVFAVTLAHCCGLRGTMLVDNVWTRMLDCSAAELHDKLVEASKQGWLNFKSAGSVTEITFPPSLLEPVQRRANESN